MTVPMVLLRWCVSNVLDVLYIAAKSSFVMSLCDMRRSPYL